MLRPNPTVRRAAPAAARSPDHCCVCGDDRPAPAPRPRRLLLRRRDGRARICVDCQGDKHVSALSEFGEGDVVRVVGIAGGERLIGRLGDLGLFPGSVLEIVSGGGRGPAIIRLEASRFALGRGMAEKILVERVEDLG